MTPNTIVPFLWTDQCQKAFEILTDVIIKSSILVIWSHINCTPYLQILQNMSAQWY